MVWLPTVFVLASISLVRASAINRRTITTLSTAEIDAFSPFTHFASTAYCNPATTIDWSCGGASISDFPMHSQAEAHLTTLIANCDANLDFQPVAVGGDGADTQFCRWLVIDLIMNDAHVPFCRVCRVLPIVKQCHRRTSGDRP